MAEPKDDDRDLLDLLKFELRFLEDGGYGRSPHAARRASLVFEDSLTCMNFNSQERTPCSACLLMHFVPPSRAAEQIPCRHIPLDPAGQTLSSLYESGSEQAEVEQALVNWLRSTIRRLERERASAAS
jgi:hypothetical protein